MPLKKRRQMEEAQRAARLNKARPGCSAELPCKQRARNGAAKPVTRSLALAYRAGDLRSLPCAEKPISRHVLLKACFRACQDIP